MRFSLAAITSMLLAVAIPFAIAGAGDDGKRIEVKTPNSKGGYRVHSQVAIGGPTAAADAQFYEKSGRVDVGADASGRIYVLDNGGPRVQVFDSRGRFVRSFGKAGEGPGEMKMPARMAVAADGHVAIFDVALQRISIYDANGKLVRDQVPQRPVRDLAWAADGSIVCSFHGPGGDMIEAFDRGGKSLWAHRPPGSTPAGGRVMVLEIGNETVASRLEAATDGAVLSASGDVYAIRRLRHGKVAETWLRPYDRQARAPMPRPSADGEDGSTMIVVRRNEGGPGGGETSVSNSRDDAATTHTFSPEDLEKMMPKHSADIRGLLAWPDGRVWVITSTNDGDNMVVDEWSDGAYRKRFGIASTWNRLCVGADGQLYGVAHDQDEYPIVHRLEVTPDS